MGLCILIHLLAVLLDLASPTRVRKGPADGLDDLLELLSPPEGVEVEPRGTKDDVGVVLLCPRSRKEATEVDATRIQLAIGGDARRFEDDARVNGIFLRASACRDYKKKSEEIAIREEKQATYHKESASVFRPAQPLWRGS